MAIQKINIEEFLSLAATYPVLDVRSPGEYKHAHIPGAYSFPLFTDEERKVVGTAYKQQSREEAIKIGLTFFGVKMRSMVEEAEKLVEECNEIIRKKSVESGSDRNDKTVLVHCWRGGMRSGGVAWLLDLYGFNVYTLVGGYKTFRRWALDQFEQTYSFRILAGFTGSGKTHLLEKLAKTGENVINLEALAHHKGSAFGNLGMPPQPSQEHFENKLALALFAAAKKPEPIWLEDESQRIGDVNTPISVWKQMRTSPVYFVDIPFEQRLKHIVAEYGKHERERLVNAVIRIKKRLGGLETKEAVNALIEDRVEDCFRILLTYYDKWYSKGLHNRDNLQALLVKIPCETVQESNIKQLLQLQV
ncbi:tRNA 2-selenouridine(34) synthase MnmH [Lacibacter sediminis]|uniref:tRNA 2-selenouridine(34) synthase MnmH n=1 Tax=Lacibacter sediminis TaxID=2760713 RepID=A0A7G5XGP1_9BACT|nr:tRNA 2-selenouridine(34) synthase MnmH [Lacibacter sediminis]QNA44644.1 tRNA 2-selenouridine(34) synthase MnmH [Lacibacter sediminis]